MTMTWRLSRCCGRCRYDGAHYPLLDEEESCGLDEKPSRRDRAGSSDEEVPDASPAAQSATVMTMTTDKEAAAGPPAARVLRCGC